MKTTPATEDQDSSGTLYVALELGWRKWKLGFTVGRAQKPRIRTVEAGDTAAVMDELRLARGRFGLAAGARVVSCYEAGRDGFWVHRFLVSEGVVSLVVDSASIEVSRRRRRAKTDRLDAGKLVSMLVRWDEGEKVWSVVRVPSEEAEQARHLHREVKTLKKEQTREVNRIRGLLAGYGVRAQTIGSDFPEWLETVRLWNGSRLPAGVRGRIQMDFDRLQLIREQITAVEGERRRLLQQGTTRDAEVARQLHRLRGIGMNSAWLYSTEFFSWRAFKNRKEVGSLAGLTPTPFQSGTGTREQGIDKAGNRRIRGMTIEIAWGWLRHQPKSALSRWYQQRFGSGSSRLRRIGIVALARKLLIALWRWVDQGTLPKGAVLNA